MWAAPSATSISSYSVTPSWATLRRPAETKRWAGAVGSPNSSARPSAVRPRRDHGVGALGLGVVGRLGQRQQHAQAVVPARVHE